MPLEDIRSLAAAESERLAKLGEWPEYKLPHAVESVAGRIPQVGETNAQGFDAGLACALDIIPREKQRLAAVLHGNYTAEAVEQVRQELKNLDADSETAWWLAASDLCTEGSTDEKKFRDQLEAFEDLAADPKSRLVTAKHEYEKIKGLFSTDQYGFPFGTEDGCIQGAYIAGYPAGAHYSKEYDLYFVGTYLPSLGLENFSWSEEKDESGRSKSGPMHGSKQFVKCANEAEFKKVLAIVKAHLKME